MSKSSSHGDHMDKIVLTRDKSIGGELWARSRHRFALSPFGDHQRGGGR